MLVGRPTRDEAARLLGIDPRADEATVRRAFRAWAAIEHPDHGGSAEHFQALCDARDALLVPAPAAPGIPLRPRQPWRAVVVRPAPPSLALLALGFAATVAAVLVAGTSPLLAMPAAIASAMWCVVVSHAVLRGGDHGHVIVTRSIAWAMATLGQLLLAAIVGIRLVEMLPLLAVPFVAVIAAVNPAAGLWRGARR
jgi:hypothetical protein